MIGTHFSRNGRLQEVKEAVIPLDDINFSYGFGVYETLKLRNGVLFFPEEHSERLLHSADVIGLSHTSRPAEIVRDLDELVAANDITDANIKVLMVGGTPDTYMFMLNPLFPPRQYFRDGVKAITYEGQRPLPQAKSLNMLISSMAYRKAQESGAYDAVLVNGVVFEGTRTNVFFTDGNRLYTPPTETVLDGVTRRHVVQLAAENGVEVVQEPIPSSAIPQFAGAFLTSTSSKVMPIAEIDGENFMIPDVVRMVQRAYERFLTEYAHERRN